MHERLIDLCPHTAATGELIADASSSGPALDSHERHAAQTHLESCTACRAAFRDATRDALPHLPNYTLLERIGRGGFGQVYKAIHHTTQRTDAVKLLARRSRLRERYFANEVHLVAKLRHPNIVTLYEAQLQPPQYFSMELVDGRHLGDHLNRREVPLGERIRIVQVVAAAIDYAHARGVVHRDVKPQNILMDRSGEPRVVDFGVAKWVDDEHADEGAVTNRTEGAVGTRGYIAPEQLRGEAVDGRADVYSLGVLLWHILTGERATSAESEAAVAARLRALDLDRADDLAAIIRRCLASDRDERYGRAGDLAEDLERYRAGQPVRARERQTLAYRAARVGTLILLRSPVLVGVLLVVLTAMLLAGVASWRGLRVATPAVPGPTAALIGVMPSTLAAIQSGGLDDVAPGISLADRHSWRRLYAAALARLAGAGPRVVAFDFYFPACRPEFDASFAAAIEASRAPVILGVRDISPAGEADVCAELAAAADGFGVLINRWDEPPEWSEFNVVVAQRRGFDDWLPSLPVAAYAAARHPQADAVFEETDRGLNLRYRLRVAEEGTSPWLTDYDELAITTAFDLSARVVNKSQGAVGAVKVADRMRETRIDARRWRPDTVVPLEEVLRADDAALRTWFSGRAVVVGQLVPGLDDHPFANGERVHGAAVHATALGALLARAHITPYTPNALNMRMLLWCGLAASLGAVLPLPRRLRLRVFSPLAVITLVAAVGLVAWTAGDVTTVAEAEVALALAAVVAISGPLLLYRAMRRRQRGLTPAVPIGVGTSTVSRTLVLATPDQST